MFKLDLKHCPTQDEILYHEEKAKKVFFNEITGRINSFMETGNETLSISEYCFEDTWVFAIVMGYCGRKLFGTKAGVAYGRSDGSSEASIVIINKEVKINRLKSELSKLSDKLANMKDTESSKYQKTVERVDKLREEISNIENSIKI